MAANKQTFQLNDANLEKTGWLFSASLQIMVGEHECGGGRWDVEVDGYRMVGDRWEPDTSVSYEAAKTVAQAIAANPLLARATDWVHGDTVEMW